MREPAAIESTHRMTLKHLFVPLILTVKLASANVIIVPSPGVPSIQNAVDLSQPGDTIQVLPGVYGAVIIPPGKENLTLTAKSGATISEESDIYAGVWIQSPGVAVEGFLVENFYVGILVDGVAETRIERNRVSGTTVAIQILNALSGRIYRNLVTGNFSGIDGSGSTELSIEHNTCSQNQNVGILLENSSDSLVAHNEANGNYNGILILSWNPENPEPVSQRIIVEHNQANENVTGITVDTSCDNIFRHNSARRNSSWAFFSTSNLLDGCNSFKNNQGEAAIPSLSFWDAK